MNVICLTKTPRNTIGSDTIKLFAAKANPRAFPPNDPEPIFIKLCF